MARSERIFLAIQDIGWRPPAFNHAIARVSDYYKCDDHRGVCDAARRTKSVFIDVYEHAFSLSVKAYNHSLSKKNN